MEIIDLSPSSSPPPPPQRRNPPRDAPRRRTPLFLPDEPMDVIELTDSEDDPPRKRRRTLSATSAAVAGPSRITPLRRREQKPSSSGRRAAQRFPFSPSPAPGSSGIRDATPPVLATPGKDPLVPNGLLGFTPPPAGDSPPQPALDMQPPPAVHAPAPRSPTPPAPAPPEDPQAQLDRHVAQVLEVIPDVSPAHVYGLLEQHRAQFKDQLVDWVLHLLFEDPTYPRCDKGKSKERSVSTQEPDIEPDYLSAKRRKGGSAYMQLALTQLQEDFPDVHAGVVIQILSAEKQLYAPAYFHLKRLRDEGTMPAEPVGKIRGKGKGKGKAAAVSDDVLGRFEKERQWVARKAQEERAKQDGELAAQMNEEEYEGAGLECGCCFATCPFDKMIQCPDAHLFCSDCVIAYAGTKLGEHNPDLTCMDMSQCALRFPDSELRRILPEKLLALYERVRQRREVEDAGLDSLEECPFCDWKAIIEADFEEDKVFRCQNEECGRVSCRRCKKEDHLPKSCEEVEEDKKLDGKHAIEEAMTRALMRNCPKCKKAFIKESGCNKMTCPNCRTLSCYICRQVITSYEHFNQVEQPTRPAASTSKSKKCLLWDPVEQRHAAEVTEAAKKALEEYKAAHPDVAEEDLKVELPVAPPPAPAPVNLHAQRLPNAILAYRQAQGPPNPHLHYAAPAPAPAPAHAPYVMHMGGLHVHLPHPHPHPHPGYAAAPPAHIHAYAHAPVAGPAHVPGYAPRAAPHAAMARIEQRMGAMRQQIQAAARAEEDMRRLEAQRIRTQQLEARIQQLEAQGPDEQMLRLMHAAMPAPAPVPAPRRSARKRKRA